jgi:hypothetical protein
MKKLILPIVLIATMMGTVTSCKKKNAETTKDKLVGTWTRKQEAVDNNGNHLMDTSEIVADTNNFTYKFNSDGSGNAAGVYSGMQVSYAINWTLTPDNKWIKLSIPSQPDTISVHIDNLDAHNLTLEDTFNSNYSWGIFTK